MATMEEIQAQIDIRKQEIDIAVRELRAKQEVPKESMTKKIFKMFSNFNRPQARYDINNYSDTSQGDGGISYFQNRIQEGQKQLQQQDIIIKRQQNMINKMKNSSIHITKDFIKSDKTKLKGDFKW